MSQVFSADSVNNTASTTVTTTSETTAVTGNFVNPPFQTAKAIVFAQFTLNPGTATNIISMRLRRNPNGENVVIGSTQTQALTVGALGAYSIQAADAIPDGRPVQYALTVQQGAATGNGTLTQCNITTFLISG